MRSAKLSMIRCPSLRFDTFPLPIRAALLDRIAIALGDPCYFDGLPVPVAIPEALRMAGNGYDGIFLQRSLETGDPLAWFLLDMSRCPAELLRQDFARSEADRRGIPFDRPVVVIDGQRWEEHRAAG